MNLTNTNYSNINTLVRKSYWESNPVKINNSNKFKQICLNDVILSKVENDIHTHHYKLYTKVNDPKIGPNIICDFINMHYVDSKNEKFKFIYTPEIIEYFMENAITICFYNQEPNSIPNPQIIGLIIGKRENLIIGSHITDSQIIETAEVNFLSTHIKVRKNNLAPLMISMYLRESIIRNNISTGHFTIGYEIKAPAYGKKYFYHYPINTKKLIKSEFMTENNILHYLANKTETKLNDKLKIIYINQNLNMPSDTIINLLYRNILSYNKIKYTICEFKTFDEFKKLFQKSFFHHFIIVENNENCENIKLCDYICMYRLDTINTSNSISYSNGYIYMGFFEDSIKDIIKYVGEFVRIYKIFDLISWSDFFDIEPNSNDFLIGTGYLNYYMFNSLVPYIENSSNGMVTI